MKRVLVFIIIISSVITGSLKAQTDINEDIVFDDKIENSTNSSKINICLGFFPAKSTFKGESSTLDMVEIEGARAVSYKGSLEIFVSKSLSLNFGIGLNNYTQTFALTNFHDSFNTNDSEQESFTMDVVGKNITEKVKIKNLVFPITINKYFSNSDKFAFYIGAGLQPGFLGNSTYESNGNYSYQGYYPAYNATFKDLPDYGFPTNYNAGNTGNLEFSKFNLGLIANTGIQLGLGSKIKCLLGLQYNSMLNKLNNTGTGYRLTEKVNDYNGIVNSYSTIKLKAFGVDLALKYRLK